MLTTAHTDTQSDAYKHSEQSEVENDLSKQWEDAIAQIISQIAAMESVNTAAQAVESLKATGGDYAKPHVHAMYLQKVPESEGFSRNDIATYLSNLDEEDELLSSYFQLIHFGGVSILESLRAFYVNLNLVALADTSSMNHLLYALGTAFKGNGGNFRGDVDDCVRIYNAMNMLNDSLHNKMAVGRSRMTEKRFMEFINDQNATDIPEFGEVEMRRIYNSVKQWPLTERIIVEKAAIEIEDSPAGNVQRTHNVPDDSATPPQGSGSSRCCVIL